MTIQSFATCRILRMADYFYYCMRTILTHIFYYDKHVTKLILYSVKINLWGTLYHIFNA